MKMLKFLAAVSGAVLTITGCDEKHINYSKLPDAARSFIEQYFGEENVISSEKDRDDNAVFFSVLLGDGTELEFDESGMWLSVDCKFSEVPAGIVPETILSDVGARYPKSSIFKIEKAVGGYVLEITGDRDLYYDSDGNFVRETI